MKVIDYAKLLKNVEEMISLLEYDAMRSAGKCKLNSQHLHSLYELKDRYVAMEAKPEPKAPAKKVAKKAPAKPEVADKE